MKQCATLLLALLGFSTKALAQVPTITAVSPAANAQNASRTGPVAVTFSQPLTSGSAAALKVYSAQRGGLRTRGATPAVVNGPTLSFAPGTSGFLPGETICSTITTAAGSSGGRLAKSRVVQFTTAAGGTGQANYQPGSEVTVGTNPSGAALADIDGDGDLDLLATNRGDGTVSVRLNGGDATGSNTGTFSNGSTASAAYAAYKIAVGDVDGDGDLDFAVAATLDRSVVIRLNNGKGVFDKGSVVTVGPYPEDPELADLDGDGDLDLLVANTVSNTVSIRFNGGDATGSATGTFSNGVDMYVGSGPGSMAVGDVEGDGDLDVVVSAALPPYGSMYAAYATTLLNDGKGKFSLGETIYGGIKYFGDIILSDIDKDGDLDLLGSVPDFGQINVFLNGGDNRGYGTYGAGKFSGGFSVPVLGTSLTTADVDADGDLDLLAVDPENNVVNVRLNGGNSLGTGAGTFSNGPDVPTDKNPAGLAVGDIDGDGDLDLVATNFGPDAYNYTQIPGKTVSVRLNQVQVPTDLVVSTPTTILGGTYRSIVITGTGSGTLAPNVIVTGSVTVQSGGTLSDGCNVLTGAGSFTLAAGATLTICNFGGIAATGTSGSVQVTGTRSFSPDANYNYTTGSYYTGTGLPSQVRNLTITAASSFYLSAPTSIAQVLTLNGNGSLELRNNALTLLSSAAGTALVVNNGSGTVSGVATVQRYLDPSQNRGYGYRHYSSPVAYTTVADLATSGFAPEISQGTVYNTSATPGTVAPFPTVFAYDQSRLASVSSNYSAFDTGFYVPASLSTPLAVGQGYAVYLDAAQVVDFKGYLNTGPKTLALSRNDATTPGAAAAGWQLVGNPYPAPIDFKTLVDNGELTNVDPSCYVFESSGPYAGTYRSYVNGVGTSSLIGTAQGFFVRVSAGQSTGSLTFRNNQRLTSYGSQVAVRRLAAARPLAHLSLQGVGQPASDDVFVYFEQGAVDGYEPRYDAEKLPNPSGLNLSTSSTGTQRLAIDGRAPLGTTQLVIPLAVGVPTAGSYTLRAAELLNLSATPTYLRDKQTGVLVNLAQQPNYQFTITDPSTLLTDRFELVFAPQQALAAAPAALAQQVVLYPNPARLAAFVELPASLSDQALTATLLDAVGRVARTVVLPARGARAHQLDLHGLPTGLYALHLHIGSRVIVKRLTIE
jgi:hypothetical protein